MSVPLRLIALAALVSLALASLETDCDTAFQAIPELKTAWNTLKTDQTRMNYRSGTQTLTPLCDMPFTDQNPPKGPFTRTCCFVFRAGDGLGSLAKDDKGAAPEKPSTATYPAAATYFQAAGEDMGHLIANQIGGTLKWQNLVPMHPAINRPTAAKDANYRDFESLMVEDIKTATGNNGKVFVKWTLKAEQYMYDNKKRLSDRARKDRNIQNWRFTTIRLQWESDPAGQSNDKEWTNFAVADRAVSTVQVRESEWTKCKLFHGGQNLLATDWHQLLVTADSVEKMVQVLQSSYEYSRAPVLLCSADTSCCLGIFVRDKNFKDATSVGKRVLLAPTRDVEALYEGNRIEGDQRGHIMADSLGGPEFKIPQPADLNVGQYAQMETEIKMLLEKGRIVVGRWNLKGVAGDNIRPTEYRIHLQPFSVEVGEKIAAPPQGSPLGNIFSQIGVNDAKDAAIVGSPIAGRVKIKQVQMKSKAVVKYHNEVTYIFNNCPYLTCLEYKSL